MKAPISVWVDDTPEGVSVPVFAELTPENMTAEHAVALLELVRRWQERQVALRGVDNVRAAQAEHAQGGSAWRKVGRA